MVNLDKWEDVTMDKIRLGDKIKRITTYKDGTHAVVTGVVDRYEDFTGTFLTKGKFALVRDHYPDATVFLYRLKKPSQELLDAKFVFPTNVGAIIDSTQKFTGEERRYVYNGKTWHWAGSGSPSHRTELDLRSSNNNFKLISEGLK